MGSLAQKLTVFRKSAISAQLASISAKCSKFGICQLKNSCSAHNSGPESIIKYYIYLSSHCQGGFPRTMEENQGWHKKGLSFDISYTKFHDPNSIHPLSVKDFVKHVVGWRLRKIGGFGGSWSSFFESPMGNRRNCGSSCVSRSLDMC